MATLVDLETDAKSFAVVLGYAAADSWADRDVSFVSPRAWVRVAWSEELQQGSNSTLRLAEIEVIFARRLATGQSYQQLEQLLLADLASATVLNNWVSMNSVRQSPRPEVEAADELAKVGQVCFFTIRARVALEG